MTKLAAATSASAAVVRRCRFAVAMSMTVATPAGGLKKVILDTIRETERVMGRDTRTCA